MENFGKLFYRIPFSETDAMKIVHHCNHPKYFERGRVEFLRLAGFDYLRMTQEGFHFPVTSLIVNYKRPLIFDDVLLIETNISELTKTRLNFSYKIFKTNELALPNISAEKNPGTPLVTGESHHCCVRDDGRPVEIPSAVYEALLKNWKGNS